MSLDLQLLLVWNFESAKVKLGGNNNGFFEVEADSAPSSLGAPHAINHLSAKGVTAPLGMSYSSHRGEIGLLLCKGTGI